MWAALRLVTAASRLALFVWVLSVPMSESVAQPSAGLGWVSKRRGPAPLAVTPIASGEVSDATVALQGIKDSNAKLKNVKNVDESFTEDKSILLRPRWN